jgi:hypothetical protein
MYLANLDIPVLAVAMPSLYQQILIDQKRNCTYLHVGPNQPRSLG